MYMKKKAVLITALVLFIAGFGWAQTAMTFSLENQISFGLFRTPYDFAFDPCEFNMESSFSNLGSNYFFGGLFNPYGFPATSSAAVPLLIGYYNGGENPWASMLYMDIDPTISTRENGITATSTAGKLVGTINHTYITDQTEDTYLHLQDEDTYISLGGGMGLGPLNCGLFITYSHELNEDGAAIDTWADNNRTRTITYYYDTALITEAPNMATDYVYTLTETDPDSDLSLDFQMPVYMPLGDSGIGGILGVEYRSHDDSTSYLESYTPPADAGAGTFWNVDDNSVTDKTGYFSVNMTPTYFMQPLFGSHNENRFEVGIDAELVFNTAGTYSSIVSDKDFDYAGSGAAFTYSNASSVETTRERKGTTEYDVDLRAKHYLYWDLAESIEFGIAPELRAGIDCDPIADTYNTTQTAINRVDGNGDGDFDDAADTITTVTTTYLNNGDGGDFTVVFDLSLPSALKFRIEGAPFGVTLGSEIGVRSEITFVKDVANTNSSTTVAVDGTGAAVSDSSTTAARSTESQSTTMDWFFDASYALALNFYLPADILLDVVLNGNNLLVFDSLSIQATIPLK
jgi:hypothetical protein